MMKKVMMMVAVVLGACVQPCCGMEVDPEISGIESFCKMKQEIKEKQEQGLKHQLMDAIAQGNFDVMKDMVEKKGVGFCNQYCFQSLLCDVCWHAIDNNPKAFDGQLKMIKYLVLQKKVDPNEMDSEGKTPIHYAQCALNPLLSKLLVEKCGARVDRTQFVQPNNFCPEIDRYLT